MKEEVQSALALTGTQLFSTDSREPLCSPREGFGLSPKTAVFFKVPKVKPVTTHADYLSDPCTLCSNFLHLPPKSVWPKLTPNKALGQQVQFLPRPFSVLDSLPTLSQASFLDKH